MVARAAGGGRQRRLGGDHKVDAGAAEELEAEAAECSGCDDPGNEEATKLAWQRREAARNRQIVIGKARPEYRKYINDVPKANRSASQPVTPDPRARVSKRQFDRALGEWRRRLHDFDAPPWHQKAGASPGVGSGARPSSPSASATEVGTGPRKGDRGKMGQRHKANPVPSTDNAPSAVVRLRLEDHLLEAEHAAPQPPSLQMQPRPGGIEDASMLMQLSDWETSYFPGFNYEPWPFSPAVASALTPTAEAPRAAGVARTNELELRELELLDLGDAELLQLGSTEVEVATPLSVNSRPGAMRTTSSPLVCEDDLTPAKLDAPTSSNHYAIPAQVKKTVFSPEGNYVQVKGAAAHGAAGRLPTPPPLPRRSSEQTDGPPPATPERRFGEVTRNPPTSIGSYSSMGVPGTPQMSRFLQVPRTPSPDRAYWGGVPQQQVWAPDPMFWSYPAT